MAKSGESWQFIPSPNVQTMLGAEVTFTINGVLYKVPDSVPPNMSLNEFIRTEANLTGTKFMCLEGGCGACVVTAKRKDPATGQNIIIAVNSCMVPIFACQGWFITTVEGIGSKSVGYNDIQKRLAKYNGLQCGYCTPGMVMNMYSLLEGKKKLSMQEVENSFGGNICRCTGYRSILDAFKSLCDDKSNNFNIEKSADIEDLPKLCPKLGLICDKKWKGDKECFSDELYNENFDIPEINFSLTLQNNAKWFKVDSKQEIFEIFDMIGDNQSYKLVAGNTANGVYREGNFDFYIDVNNVPELFNWSINDSALTLGANIPLTKAMDIFTEVSAKYSNFKYLKNFANHIDLIANVPIRNIGTLAGNLCIKNQHNEFPSDIFVMFSAVGATFNIEMTYGNTESNLVEAVSDITLWKSLITSFTLPSLDDSYVVQSYKIMPRAQNAHAYVNAGFKFRVNKENKFSVSENPAIIFGGIKPSFVHASQTEAFLVGKALLNSEVIQQALAILSSELNPDSTLLDASPAYRKGLAQSLFYKFVLSLSPNSVNSRFKNGGEILSRPLSSGQQSFDCDKTLWPVNEPITKIEALVQCAGEAEFVNDIHAPRTPLYGAFVLAPKGPATLVSVNAQKALAIPGVKAFFSAKNIPGTNSAVPNDDMTPLPEELFAAEKILYAGQPVGMIVATSSSLANKAIQKVEVNLKDVKKPLLSTDEVLKSGDKSRIKIQDTIERKTKKDNIKHVIKGSFEAKEQYHFTMETQSCLVVPNEEGIDVYPTSQHLSGVQAAISSCLGIPENSINVQNRRLGGGYGSKISRNGQISVACALAAYILNKPVRMVLTIEANMQVVGKRYPCLSNYEVGVDDEGEIQYLNVDVYQDGGCSLNENPASSTIGIMPSGYNSETWTLKSYAVLTDKSKNTWCRAPGTTEAIATTEHIFEHIAFELNKDPLEIRAKNYSDAHRSSLQEMISSLKQSSDFESRKQQVDVFNEKNRWRKKGITLIPMVYPMVLWGNYHALVSIYREDGTVAISHGGIEMGQGLNTKAAQTCAYKLGIKVDMIKIKPSNVLVSPNNACTGGSITSEAVSLAVIKCCDQLLARLAPYKSKLKDPSWLNIIKAAAGDNVSLNAIHMYTSADYGKNVKFYSIYGVTAIEVEVDLLTGNYLISRCDILEDAGISLSPEIDIGQVEGAFVMGLGYWLTEQIIFDPETGLVVTDRTWSYKPPGAKDIPIDFRISLRKNAANPVGVLRSKATGEPPLCMSCSVTFALRNAITAARKETEKTPKWAEIVAPFSPEKVFLAAFTGTSDYKL